MTQRPTAREQLAAALAQPKRGTRLTPRQVQDRLVTEKQLQDCVIGLARTLGYLAHHEYDSRRSEPGYPDVTIVGYGLFMMPELKTQLGRVRLAQRKWIAALHEAGIDAPVWRPSDCSSGEIERILRRGVETDRIVTNGMARGLERIAKIETGRAS